MELAGAVINEIYRRYLMNALQDLLHKGKVDKEGRRKEFIESILDRKMQNALRESVRIAKEFIDEVKRAYENMGYSFVRIDFALESKGLVGTSSGMLATIFEVGLEIDPILGLPYYPASTLKGASRASCYLTLSAGGNDHSRACDYLFGSAGGYREGHASLVIFSDAYPVGCIGGPCTIYVGDVLTPHYYQGGKPVGAEYEAMPVPIVHMSIADGTVFSTIIASREAIDRESAERAEGEIREWIYENRDRREARILENALNSGGNSSLATVAAVFLVSALASGFAARSGKGYNKAKLISEEDAVNAYSNLESTVRVLRITTG